MVRFDTEAEALLRSIFGQDTLQATSRPCVRGCVRTVGDETERRPARYGGLCGSCYWRIAYRLGEAPKILFALRSSMVPLKAQALTEKVSGTKDPSLPFLESSAPDADAFFGILADWSVSFAEQWDEWPPASVSMLFKSGENCPGLPSSPERARVAIDEVTEWLGVNAERIAWSPLVTDYHDDIVAQTARYRSRAGLVQPRPRVRGPRPCPVCLEESVEVSVPDVGPIAFRCTNCHEVIDATAGFEAMGVAA